MDAAALFADVVHYASLAPHRSGTAGDHATSAWIASRLRAAAWSVDLSAMTVQPFFEYQGCEMIVSGEHHECFAVWLPNASCVGGALPIRHAAAAASAGAPPIPVPPVTRRHVSLVEVSTATLAGGAGSSIQSSIQRGAAAVVVINGAGSLGGPAPNNPEPTALNAPPPYSGRVWPVPVLLAGGAARAALLAPDARVDRLCVHGRLHPDGASTTHNVLAHLSIPAKRPTSRPPRRLVVSTPTTGWFRCGGERGPGVALLLFLARTLPGLIDQITKHAVELLFVASAAHELGQLGATAARAHAEARGFTPAATDLWLALGSTISNWQTFPPGGQQGRGVFRSLLHYSAASLAPVAAPLRSIGFQPALRAPEALRGELAHVARAGYPAMGFYGHGFKFHVADDDANSTSGEMLGEVASALLEACRRLLDDDAPLPGAPADASALAALQQHGQAQGHGQGQGQVEGAPLRASVDAGGLHASGATGVAPYSIAAGLLLLLAAFFSVRRATRRRAGGRLAVPSGDGFL